MADVSFFDASGQFSQQAWHDYWSALWSAPTQPGYATLVREGLAALFAMAQTLNAQAQVIGATEAATLTNEAMLQLPLYISIAGATQDGEILRRMVVTPNLTEGDSPFLKIARAMPLLIASRPIRSWTQIFEDEIVAPTQRAATAVGRAAVRSINILPIAIGVGVVWYLASRGGS